MTTNRKDDRDEPFDEEPKEGDTDYELSESHGYSDWDKPKRNWVRPIVIGFSIFLLISMLLPMLAPFIQ